MLDLDWTAVRVPWLSDDARRGYRSANGVRLHHGPKLGREDLATYFLSIVDGRSTFDNRASALIGPALIALFVV